MNIDTIQKKMEALGAETELVRGILNVSVSKDMLYETARALRFDENTPFDFLSDIVGMDYGVEEGLGTIYILSSSKSPSNIVALKTMTTDREEPRLYSVSDLWQSAGVYEREVHDFFGIEFINNPDMRRLYLRSDWVGYPLRKDWNYDPAVNPIPKKDDDLLAMEIMPAIEEDANGNIIRTTSRVFDQEDFVVNFGPQHPSTHGVLHIRTAVEGETITKVDPNLGYIHRGIEKMCEGYTYPQILHLTERLDYLSSSINRHCIALCCEEALELEVPMRAHYIRTIIDELTRIASHLLGWGCTAMDMGAITAFVYAMRDREKIMDIFEETTGGRLMTNYSVIGGVAYDIHPNFQRRVKEFIPYMRKMLKEHHTLFTGNPIVTGRMRGVGALSTEEAISIGTTGPAGRASGWHNDIRNIAPYGAYGEIEFKELVRTEGYTFDRYIIRLDEIEESLNIIERLVDNIPEGDYKAKTRAVIRLPEGQFYKRVENARGEFSVFIDSRGDKSPYRVKFRSPSLALVNTLRPTIVGTKVADLVMVGASLDFVIPCIDR